MSSFKPEPAPTSDATPAAAPTVIAPAPVIATAPVPTPAAATPPPARRRNLFIALGTLAVLSVTAWWFVHRNIEDTDDAQIDGDVIAVPARLGGLVTAVHFNDNQVVHQGDLLAEIDPAPARARLDQADAELASAKASAQAAAVDAQLAESNAKGQRSVAEASLKGAQVNVTASSSQIAEADAQLASAVAAFKKAQLDLQRARELAQVAAMPQAQVDAVQAAYDSAEAKVAESRARAASLRASSEQASARVSEASARFTQASTVGQQIAQARARAQVADARVANAQAQRDLAALDLAYTQIHAPEDGVVSRRAINLGQMVPSGAAIVQLVPTSRLWVTGNFKETQLANMRVGQPATIRIDAYRGRTLHGRLESFSAATGARFSLLPPDNASGNYTKVVQRLPVRVTLLDAPKELVLRPGMSVEVAVDTGK